MSVIRKILVATTITALLLLGVGFAAQPAQAVSSGALSNYTGIPTFSIVSVKQDESVTVKPIIYPRTTNLM